MSDTTRIVGGALPALGATASADAARYRIVPARHRARTAGTVFGVVLIALVLRSLLGNPNWGWPVFAEWFLSEPVLSGLARTLWLTLLGALFGFTLGVPLALARASRSRVLAASAWIFIWLFRSIPLIVLLLVLNNLGYLYEHIRLGVPFTDLTFVDISTTELIGPFLAAVLGLTLNHAAFSAEVIRGGILSVDQGQLEAAAALGLPRARQAWRIVLPQAMRAIRCRSSRVITTPVGLHGVAKKIAFVRGVTAASSASPSSLKPAAASTGTGTSVAPDARTLAS